LNYKGEKDMNEETYEALKRIIREVKEKRKYDCFNKHCVCNHMIGGNDIDLVEVWLHDNKGGL
jgi:hypothetical protein